MGGVAGWEFYGGAGAAWRAGSGRGVRQPGFTAAGGRSYGCQVIFLMPSPHLRPSLLL